MLHPFCLFCCQLLNYEEDFLKELGFKPLSRHYFAIATNPGEQFYMFTSLSAWLINLSGRQFDKPQEVIPSVARSCDVLYSHVGTKFAQNLHFAIYVCVQNTWKLLIFLKCTKTVFMLSLGPFAQFLIS